MSKRSSSKSTLLFTPAQRAAMSEAVANATWVLRNTLSDAADTHVRRAARKVATVANQIARKGAR